jgi:hypothetical protein
MRRREKSTLLATALIVACTLVCSGTLLADSARPAGTCELTSAEEQKILEQPIEVFDVDESAGWRSMWKRRCPDIAVTLLTKYQEKNGSSYRLSFHQAQLKLTLGYTKDARRLLFASLRPELSSENPFRWNDYVLGYLAYVDNDEEALRYYLGRLRARDDNLGNAMNAQVLAKLLSGIGQPYATIFPSP